MKEKANLKANFPQKTNKKETKKCLACQKEIISKWKRSFCKDKCQREYNDYKKGKKKKEEMFIDLRKKGKE